METNLCGDLEATRLRGRYRRAWSVHLQVEMDVDGTGRVGDGAHRNKIGTGFGVGPDRFQRNAARKLYGCALADDANPFLSFFRTEIVEQKSFRTASQCFV